MNFNLITKITNLLSDESSRKLTSKTNKFMIKNTLGGLLTIGILAFGGNAIAQRNVVGRIYAKVHVQNGGGGDWEEPNATARWIGTRGEGRRLEGFLLELKNVPGVELQYMCHLQNIGDQGWFRQGNFCGTRGQGRRLEGFAIELVGQNARRYSVKYQCHLQNIKDTGVMQDGQYCGTRDQKRRLEAMRVWVVKR